MDHRGPRKTGNSEGCELLEAIHPGGSDGVIADGVPTQMEATCAFPGLYIRGLKVARAAKNLTAW